MNENLKEQDSLDVDPKSLQYRWVKMKERLGLYKDKLDMKSSINYTMANNDFSRDRAERLEHVLRDTAFPVREQLDINLVDIEYLRALFKDLKRNRIGQLEYCLMKNGWDARPDDIINYPNLTDLYLAILHYKESLSHEESVTFEEWIGNQLKEIIENSNGLGEKVANRLLLALEKKHYSQKSRI